MQGGYVKGYANGGVAIIESGPPKMDTFEQFKNRQPVSGLGPESNEAYLERYKKYVDFFNSGAPEQGYANVGVAQPTLKMPPQQSIPKNPNIEAGYYDSPEYKDFMENKSTGIGTANIRYSPYFGQQGTSLGGCTDPTATNYNACYAFYFPWFSSSYGGQQISPCTY